MKTILADLDFGLIAKATNHPDPTNDQDVATKAYVDSSVSPTSWKDSVRVASTTNINLAGPGSSIDAISLDNNDRVLLKDQTDASENGIYIFNGAASPLTRSTDSSTFDELEQAVVSVEEGSSADTTFRQTAVNGTLGTDDILFTSFGTAAPSASESTAGIAEVATQAETDAGSDDTRFVTPAKLANWSGKVRKQSQTIGDGSSTSFNFDHNFGTRDVVVSVYRNSGSYDEVIADVTRPSLNRVTITFAAAPASNAFRVVVSG